MDQGTLALSDTSLSFIISSGAVSVISFVLLGFVPNFLCAGFCGCGCISGCCNCYVAGLVFVAAMSFAYDITITEKCKDEFHLIINNTKDSNNIFQEVDGTCYRYNKDFTMYLSWVYYIGIAALGFFLIAFAISLILEQSKSKAETKTPEDEPMVAQSDIESESNALKF